MDKFGKCNVKMEDVGSLDMLNMVGLPNPLPTAKLSSNITISSNTTDLTTDTIKLGKLGNAGYLETFTQHRKSYLFYVRYTTY